jgi:drug/metabolite transporter (DMT)-like permease
MSRRAWTMMWMLALLWGASYLFIKVALEDMSPVFLVWSRLVLASLMLIPMALHAGALHGLPLRPIVLLASIQVVAPFLLITFGEQHVASSLAGILVASAPIFTALLGMAGLGGDRVGRWSLGGILLGLAGVAMLFGVDLSGDSSVLLGGLMILLAGFGYAVGAIYLRSRLHGLPPIGVAAGSMSAGAAILTVPAALSLPDALPGLQSLGALAALGIGGTGLAFALFYKLIADLGAAKASVVAYLAPGFALAYGALLLDEPVTAGAVAGLGLILAGSWTAAEGRPPGRRRAVAGHPAPA